MMATYMLLINCTALPGISPRHMLMSTNSWSALRNAAEQFQNIAIGKSVVSNSLRPGAGVDIQGILDDLPAPYNPPLLGARVHDRMENKFGQWLALLRLLGVGLFQSAAGPQLHHLLRWGCSVEGLRHGWPNEKPQP